MHGALIVYHTYIDAMHLVYDATVLCVMLWNVWKQPVHSRHSHDTYNVPFAVTARRHYSLITGYSTYAQS
jgi:hypothetical protein